MILTGINAVNFRNIPICDIKFCDGVNLLFGDNAQGKTNIIEAIYHFARGKSFRTSNEDELIRFGEGGFSMHIDFTDKGEELSLDYAYWDKKRRRRKNGYVVRYASEVMGAFRAVLFYPDDLSLVKGSPDGRRSFINVAIGQICPRYISDYSSYKKCLESRNCLLKMKQKGEYIDSREVDSWSQTLAGFAARIYTERKKYLNKLGLYMRDIMREISDGKERVEVSYISEIDSYIFGKDSLLDKDEEEYTNLVKQAYIKLLLEQREREEAAGVTLIGPHREDFYISINNADARAFASQGQQRSVVIAMKMAEGEVSREVCGSYPVFLLDDVMSELDEGRRDYIMRKCSDRQLIISSCESVMLCEKNIKIISVDGGEYKEI